MPGDLPIPPCPRCNSSEWHKASDGIHCASGHPLRPSLLMSPDAPKPSDFTWDGVKGYAHVLHEPSLLTLRHHANAAMVHLAIAQAAHAELAGKHAALEARFAELERKHEGLIALYKDVWDKHQGVIARNAEIDARVRTLEGVQGGLFDVSVHVVPKEKEKGTEKAQTKEDDE